MATPHPATSLIQDITHRSGASLNPSFGKSMLSSRPGCQISTTLSMDRFIHHCPVGKIGGELTRRCSVSQGPCSAPCQGEKRLRNDNRPASFGTVTPTPCSLSSPRPETFGRQQISMANEVIRAQTLTASIPWRRPGASVMRPPATIEFAMWLICDFVVWTPDAMAWHGLAGSFASSSS